MLDPIRAAADALGEPLSLVAYQTWRESQDPQPPSAWSLGRKFGGWPAACRASGVQAAGESYRRWTRDDHLEAVRLAGASVAGPLTPTGYRKWRAGQPEPRPTLDGYSAPEWTELCRQAGVVGEVMGRR